MCICSGFELEPDELLEENPYQDELLAAQYGTELEVPLLDAPAHCNREWWCVCAGAALCV